MATAKKSAAKAKGKKTAPKKAVPRKPAAKPKPAPKKPAPKKAAPKPAPKPAPKKAPLAERGSAAPRGRAASAAPPPKPAAKPAPPKPTPPPAKKPEPVAKPAAPSKAAKPEPAKPAAAPAPAPAAPSAAPAVAAAKAAKVPKKKPIPTTSLAATPIFRPLNAPAGPLAPPPPPAKPGHADHQILSAISYGLFAAINKTFGFAGRNVVKNAALRMLEYGYKRGWLPPKSKEPVRALNEFFGRLETMGYAEKIHVAKHGDHYALEVQGLADFDAVHSLREMHYPLLPIFLGEMLEAIVDQYFQLKVTVEPLEMQDQKRGFTLPFSLHERPAETVAPTALSYSRTDDFEE